MTYLILVSHGMFAPGLANALGMLAGHDREDVLVANLEDGMSAETFESNFRKTIAKVTKEDSVLLLADLVGGSPLTTASNVLFEEGLIGNTVMLGGMNLPMALEAVLMKDTMDLNDLKGSLIADAKDTLKEFCLDIQEEDDI